MALCVLCVFVGLGRGSCCFLYVFLVRLHFNFLPEIRGAPFSSIVRLFEIVIFSHLFLFVLLRINHKTKLSPMHAHIHIQMIRSNFVCECVYFLFLKFSFGEWAEEAEEREKMKNKSSKMIFVSVVFLLSVAVNLCLISLVRFIYLCVSFLLYVGRYTQFVVLIRFAVIFHQHIRAQTHSVGGTHRPKPRRNAAKKKLISLIECIFSRWFSIPNL